MCASILSTDVLTHSMDAAACYIIVMPCENLVSPKDLLLIILNVHIHCEI